VIENEELLSIVPHRGKMLLLSRVTDYSLEEKTVEAEYNVTEECLFYDPSLEGVPCWVGFEFIAQTIAVFSGLKSRAKGEPAKMGFILSVSQTRITMPVIKNGSVAKIKIKEVENVDLLFVFTGEIFLENEKIFEGKITVIDVDDEQAERIKRGSNAIG